MAVKAEWESVVFDYSLMKTFYFNQIYDKIECFLNNYNKKRIGLLFC
jgi:hypothetical protein